MLLSFSLVVLVVLSCLLPQTSCNRDGYRLVWATQQCQLAQNQSLHNACCSFCVVLWIHGLNDSQPPWLLSSLHWPDESPVPWLLINLWQSSLPAVFLSGLSHTNSGLLMATGVHFERHMLDTGKSLMRLLDQLFS